MKRHNWFLATAVASLLAISSSLVHAAPYASGITVTGTSVTYILNEDADSLTFTDNGTPITYTLANSDPQVLKGSHTVTLGSATNTFSFAVDKTESGFTTPDGSTLVTNGGGLAYDTAQFNGQLISTLSNPLTKFNSPRGVAVSNNPNAPNFGNVYISNSAASTTIPAGRTANIGKGLYALKADQTDGYGYGDTAQDVAAFAGASANSPYKTFVGTDGTVYTAGFGDAASNVYKSSPDLLTNSGVFVGNSATTDFSNANGGTAGCATAGLCLAVGQNHGSSASVYVEGTSAASNLTVYTLDEDMTAQLTRANATDPKGTDNNKLWKYSIGGSALPYGAMPTAVTPSTPLIEDFSIIIDVDRGADGKFYVSQNRSQPANATGLFVLDANGNVLFDSAKASAKAIPTASTKAGDFNHDSFKNAADYVMWRKQQGTSGPDADADNSGTVDIADYNIWRGGNPALTGAAAEAGFGDVFNDLYSNIQAISVSPDQKWLATWHTNNIVAVTPLIGGIPDVANRMALNLVNLVGNARDMSFDAAGNLHFVSSGLGQYLVIAPGGHTVATTSWNGSSYAFNINTIPGAGSIGGGTVPEPGTLVLALTGVLALGFGRRRQ